LLDARVNGRTNRDISVSADGTAVTNGVSWQDSEEDRSASLRPSECLVLQTARCGADDDGSICIYSVGDAEGVARGRREGDRTGSLRPNPAGGERTEFQANNH
jgi:hypothetical protein